MADSIVGTPFDKMPEFLQDVFKTKSKVGAYVPRPLSEIYANYIPQKGVITPFNLKKWNAGRVSILNPEHPMYRR